MNNHQNNVILLILDAFRGDYISKDNTPNLYEFSKNSKYIKYLKPSFGFCERTEILTGKTSKESGYFTALGLDPKNSPYKDYKKTIKLFSIFDKLIPILIFQKILRRLFWIIFKKKKHTFYPFNIPFMLLSKLNLTEDGKDSLINNSFNSIYKLSNGVFNKATTDMSSSLSGDDHYRLKITLENLLNNDYQFYPVYISNMDYVGHYHGPSSGEAKNALIEVDSMIADFIGDSFEKDKDCTIIICGDHGMTEVKNKIDIEATIKNKLDESSFKNLNYFLDSTIARFWQTKKSEDEFRSISNLIEDEFGNLGKVVSRCDYERYDIPNSIKYGDFCFICNPGTIINPDFFNTKKNLKGMHGYNSSDISTLGFCMLLSNKIKSPFIDENIKNLTKVYELIKDSLDPKLYR